jgi:NAD(P)-dependent dehydrogenase (short-subunit alcohol dehydrogenase family)
MQGEHKVRPYGSFSVTDIWKLFDLTRRVFLVVGGARDLGWDMAQSLAQAHADGAITSRDATSAQAAAKRMADETGRRVLGFGLDAASENAVERCVARVVEEFGRIDVLVNNVGGLEDESPEDVEISTRPRQTWDRTLTANVTAPFLITKHVIPIMRRQKSGSIINIASIAGLIGRDRSMYEVTGVTATRTDYAAAKGAVISMTRDLAAVLGRDGIRVNAISPGGFERGQPANFVAAYRARTPLGRMGRDGEDLCGAVVFLASDASGYVTGHNLVVDGGFTIWQ